MLLEKCTSCWVEVSLALEAVTNTVTQPAKGRGATCTELRLTRPSRASGVPMAV